MNPQKNKTRLCSVCGSGKVMSGELGRQHNAKLDNGKICCADCKANEIFAKIGRR